MNQQVAHFCFSCIDLGLVNTYLLLAAFESPKTAYFRPRCAALNPMARSLTSAAALVCHMLGSPARKA